jgi:hypothetical protein
MGLVLALMAISAPTSTAAFEPTITSCNPGVNDASSWSLWDASEGGFSLDDYCSIAEGLQIHNYDSQVNEEGGWAFNPGAGASVVSYSFDIEGGDTSTGIKYAARGCDGCSDDQDIGERNDSSLPDRIEVDAPSSSESVIIYAKCMNPDGCAATANPLRISNLAVTVSDTAPPEVRGEIPGYLGNPSYPEELLGWTNKSLLPVRLFADDPGGFGIVTAAVSVDGVSTAVETWDFISQCSDIHTLMAISICPNSVSPVGVADLTGETDGIHELFFSAADVADNYASTSAGRIGLDRSAPAQPESGAFEFTSSGWPGQRWTSDPDVTMTWDPVPEPFDPDLESPIAAQTLSVRRPGSPTIDESSVPLNLQSQSSTLLSDGEWDVSVRFDDQAGNAGTPFTRRVGLDVDAPNAPTNLTVDEWYSAAGIATRPRLSWDAPSDNPNLESGVCGYVLRIDDQPLSVPVFGQDESAVGTSWPLPAGLPDGQSYFHIRAVSCAGVASTTETIALNMDTTAPEISVAGLATDGAWKNHTQQASISATDAGSGVVEIGYAIDSEPVTWSSGDNTSVELPEGPHVLTSYARDLAGNVRTLVSAANTDTKAPSIDLATASVADPALSSARVQDVDSGLSSLAIELRRVDPGADTFERDWQAVGGAEPITRGETDAVDVSRRIDDAQLAPGDYELRVNARDVAGNSSAEGSFAIRSMRLPLRRPAELSIGVADIVKVCRTAAGKACKSVKRCSAKSRCRMVRIVNRENAKAAVVRTWSSKSAVVGDALDSNGAPLSGVSVAISATSPFHDPEPLGTVQTDSAGRYELRVSARPTSTFTARIAGDATQQPAIASANRIVRSELSFNPKPRAVRAGKTMLLAGRVLHDAWLPVGGVTVRFQWYSPNGWADFWKPTQADATGRFSTPYPWSASAKRSSVLLRARIDEASGWPFAPGSSDSKRIQVLPAR